MRIFWKIAFVLLTVTGLFESCDRDFPEYPFDEHNFVADKAVAYYEGLVKGNPACMRFTLIMVLGETEGGKIKSDGAIAHFVLNAPFSLKHVVAEGEYTGSYEKNVSRTFLLKDSYLDILTPKMDTAVSYPIEGGTLKVVAVEDSGYSVSAAITANGEQYSFKYSGTLDVIESN